MLSGAVSGDVHVATGCREARDPGAFGGKDRPKAIALPNGRSEASKPMGG